MRCCFGHAITAQRVRGHLESSLSALTDCHCALSSASVTAALWKGIDSKWCTYFAGENICAQGVPLNTHNAQVIKSFETVP